MSDRRGWKPQMPREVEKGAVVNDKTIRVFTAVFAVVENLARYAANRLERGNAAAQKPTADPGE
jgi:hypothetical protein